MNRLAEEGRHPFSVDPRTGAQIRTGVQGSEYLRHGDRIRPALATLDSVWEGASAGLAGAPGPARIRARQAAAITAVGRLMYRSALARTESRGMSTRSDHPELDPAQHHHILSGGLDEVWTAAALRTGSTVSAAVA